MKVYLLTCSEDYYPMEGTMDWKGLYPSREAAKDALRKLDRVGIIVEIDTETMQYAEVYKTPLAVFNFDTGKYEEGLDA